MTVKQEKLSYLAHVLALIQISGLEDITVLQSECLATLDKLFNVLHLDCANMLITHCYFIKVMIDMIEISLSV